MNVIDNDIVTYNVFRCVYNDSTNDNDNDSDANRSNRDIDSTIDNNNRRKFK